MQSNSSARRISVIMAFFVGLILAVYTVPKFAHSQQGALAQQQVGQRLGIQSYAQLTIKGDSVTWDPGGNEIPRIETLPVTYRRLGGNQRPTLVNLLNVIGSDGWELVLANDNIWTFKK